MPEYSWRSSRQGIQTLDEVIGRECVQQRLACSVGVSPTGARVRSPVAWVTSVEETNLVKLTDKAVFGTVSELPGRNASEPISGLVKNRFRRPSPLPTGEGSMAGRNLTVATSHSGGVVGAARGQGHAEQLEKPSSSRREIDAAGSAV